jgi:membrane protease YdiL (CAAX protease family)
MSTLNKFPILATLREWWVSLVGIVIALFGAVLLIAVLSATSIAKGLPQWVPLIGPHWLVTGVVVAVVLWAEGRGLASIGLEWPSLHDLGWTVVAFVGGTLTFLVTRPLVELLGLSGIGTGGGIRTILSFPIGIVVALSVMAGISEEVLYRGYPIERLSELTGSIWIGAALTVVMFTAAHIPLWGLGGALQIGGWTVVVTVLYVRLRNLPACILMHTCNDLFAYVVLPYFLGGG